MEFKKHDRVYWFDYKGSKVRGYVWGKLREVYFVIDNEGKEWVMYPEELRFSQTFTTREVTHG